MKYKWTRKLLAAALTVTLLAGSAGGMAVQAENEVSTETAVSEEETGVSAEDELTSTAEASDSVEQTAGETEASTEETAEE